MSTASSAQLFILTGASRGMGAAIARQLASTPNARLLCLSRGRQLALDGVPGVEQWAIDLAREPREAAAKLQGWLAAQGARTFASAALINNAAGLTRIGAIEDGSDDELCAALRVGLEAPVLLTAAFLRATRTWPAARRVLNISSGLGRRAMAGQAAYCAVKAGLDHFTRAVALDEATHPHPAQIVSLAPGVIDTDMQVQLRAGDPAGFPERERFVELKTSGQLTSPDEAARRVLAYLARPDFGANPIADVREA